jgi:hypothetical protein
MNTRRSRHAFRQLGAALLLTVVGLAGPAAAQQEKPLAHGFTPKLTAPIGIEFTIAAEPRVGEALSVALTVTAEAALGNGLLQLAADDGLTVTEPVAEVALGNLDVGEVAEVAVTVIPLTGGRQYLHVSVTADIRGERQTRSIAVPIRTPAAGALKPDDVPSGKAGEAVRSLGAVETVR